MLISSNRISLLTFVSWFHIAGLIQCYYIPYDRVIHPVDNFFGCHDTSEWIPQLMQMPPFKALSSITLPLMNGIPEGRAVRENLLRAVQNGINLDGVIAKLVNVPIYNKYDVLISTLMAISEYINLECGELNRVIIYLLKKRFLGNNNFSMDRGFGRSTSSCSCYVGSLVENFLKRFVQQQSLETMSSAKVEMQVSEFSVDTLLRLIPKPKFETGEAMYQKLIALLKSEQVQQIIQTIDRSQYKTEQEFLDVVLIKISQTITTTEVQEVINFFINYKEVTNVGFYYANLLGALPLPKTSREITYYNLFKHLMMSKDIYLLMQNFHFEQNESLENIFTQVARYLIQSQSVSVEIKEACNYYLSVIQGRQYNVNFSDLLLLLPQPATPGDSQYYNVLKSLFSSNEIYVLIRDFNIFKQTSNKEDLLRKLLFMLQTHVENQTLVQAARYYTKYFLVQKYGFNYFELLNLLHLSEAHRQYRDVIEYYMCSPEFEMILTKLDLSSLTEVQKLMKILIAIQSNATNAEIVNAVQQLLRIVYKEQFVLEVNRILTQIPPPQSEEDRDKLEIITGFLTSDLGYELLHDVDVSLFPDDKLLLEHYFQVVMESDVAPLVLEAFKYYYDKIENLEEVEFVRKKEINKHFKLYQIFKDVLDLRSLELPQKEAFINFYKYISKVNPGAISDFNSWDKAATRGEFVKLLFDYVLGQNAIPEEVKQEIMVLEPLVHMTGSAALPP